MSHKCGFTGEQEGRCHKKKLNKTKKIIGTGKRLQKEGITPRAKKSPIPTNNPVYQREEEEEEVER